MNRYSQFTLFALALLYAGCAPALLKDRDGNSYTTHGMPDKKDWMTHNLNINIPGSFCYDDEDLNCLRYGRLYTWEMAKAGCELLGSSWRLPTNDEWAKMAKHYGGVYQDTLQNGKIAYDNLIDGGGSKFNALHGGGLDSDGEYRRIDAHGFYWTATEIDSTNAWFYNFGKTGKMLNRHSGEKSSGKSVRCIRD
jgi:uncharacterized protein (TIGR02145 family)